MFKFKGTILSILVLSSTASIQAEPWIDTHDQFLRADIELLVDVGIIKEPITTYPLMWSGIIKDLDNVETANIDSRYVDVYWRVKKAGKTAVSGAALRKLSISAANNEQSLRSFGDSSRGRSEISANNARVTKHFAWNLQVTQVDNPKDKEETRYDDSYLAGVIDNWILTAGWVEKWWGPGWDSSNILSNNARPPLGISLQRNYSDRASVPVLQWLGPWTFNTFVAKLDDDKQAELDSKIAGVSFTFKPHQSLEIGLRATALWGAKNQKETLDSLLDTFVAYESCSQISDGSTSECNSLVNTNGDRIAGIDFRWKLPIDYPLALYASHFGEDETQPIPSKAMSQFGLSSMFTAFGSNWRTYLEYSDARLGGTEYNQAYESEVYRVGYRYRLRAIGSTYDSDSTALSLGVLGTLNRYNQFSFKIQDIDINQDSNSFSELATHTVSTAAQKFKRLQLQWICNTGYYGQLDFNYTYVDHEFADVESRFNVSWVYGIE